MNVSGYIHCHVNIAWFININCYNAVYVNENVCLKMYGLKMYGLKH